MSWNVNVMILTGFYKLFRSFYIQNSSNKCGLRLKIMECLLTKTGTVAHVNGLDLRWKSIVLTTFCANSTITFEFLPVCGLELAGGLGNDSSLR